MTAFTFFRHTSSRAPVMWSRAQVARFLNAACGTSQFHIWNVGELPDVEVHQLMVEMEMEGELGNR